MSIAERRLARLKKQADVAGATNLEEAELLVLEASVSLKQSQAELRLLRTYVHSFRHAELEFQLRKSKTALTSLKLEGGKALEEAASNIVAAETALQVATDKLKRAEQAHKSSRIHASQDGPVVHANVATSRMGAGVRLEAGAIVRERQPVVRFPDYSQFQHEVLVPESQVGRVRIDQPVSVKIDAFSDRIASGKVTQVSRRPQSRARINRGVREFAVVVSLTQTVPGCKPGLTGVAEIDVSRRD